MEEISGDDANTPADPSAAGIRTMNNPRGWISSSPHGHDGNMYEAVSMRSHTARWWEAYSKLPKAILGA